MHEKEARQIHPHQKYIDAMRQGDDALIKEAYELCIDQLKNFVLKNSGNASDVEDLHHQAFIKIFNKAFNEPDFSLYVPFCGFYYLVYRTTWLNNLKKNGRKNVIISDLDGYNNETHAKQFASELGSKEVLLDKLCIAFNKLGERCKKLLKLKYKESLSSKEIAGQLNIEVSNVNKSMHNCRANLKKIMS